MIPGECFAVCAIDLFPDGRLFGIKLLVWATALCFCNRVDRGVLRRMFALLAGYRMGLNVIRDIEFMASTATA